MKKIFILVALTFFSFSNGQGTIQINNFTSYTLSFQLVAELDDSCAFNLAGWNTTHSLGYQYMFLLPAGDSVTYTSYLDTGVQSPNMNRFKKSDSGSLYPLTAAETLYGNLSANPSYWAFSKFSIHNSDGSTIMSSTIGVPSDCIAYPYYDDNGTIFAEFFTLGGTTYFNIY